MLREDSCEGDKTRWTLEERLDVDLETPWPWRLSAELFGDAGCDINDFMPDNYVYFLDHVRSREDLIRGLRELSPFADDALGVAEGLSEREFCDFKICLACERRRVDSRMPEKYRTLIFPKRFITALFVSDKCQAPLGAALIQLMKTEEDKL